MSEHVAPPPAPFASWLDWAVEQGTVGRVPAVAAELAALRARAAEADAMWECSGCGAHFSPLARLPDGADPNTGANRCTRCVEAEALAARALALRAALAAAEALVAALDEFIAWKYRADAEALPNAIRWAKGEAPVGHSTRSLSDSCDARAALAAAKAKLGGGDHG